MLVLIDLDRSSVSEGGVRKVAGAGANDTNEEDGHENGTPAMSLATEATECGAGAPIGWMALRLVFELSARN